MTNKPQTTLHAYCIRTLMCGGGTSYDVYFLKSDKPSQPLHGSTYATEIWHGKHKFYRTEDAIDRRERWSMPQGWEKWESWKALEKVAKRLAVRIAKRAFPELHGHKQLPSLWAPWDLPSKEVKVPVQMTLPE